jgi:hypothetical protein
MRGGGLWLYFDTIIHMLMDVVYICMYVCQWLVVAPKEMG